jgi:hypothetical protein
MENPNPAPTTYRGVDASGWYPSENGMGGITMPSPAAGSYVINDNSNAARYQHATATTNSPGKRSWNDTQVRLGPAPCANLHACHLS